MPCHLYNESVHCAPLQDLSQVPKVSEQQKAWLLEVNSQHRFLESFGLSHHMTFIAIITERNSVHVYDWNPLDHRSHMHQFWVQWQDCGFLRLQNMSTSIIIMVTEVGTLWLESVRKWLESVQIDWIWTVHTDKELKSGQLKLVLKPAHVAESNQGLCRSNSVQNLFTNVPSIPKKTIIRREGACCAMWLSSDVHFDSSDG